MSDDAVVWEDLLPKLKAQLYAEKGLRLSLSRLAAMLLREAAERALSKRD